LKLSQNISNTSSKADIKEYICLFGYINLPFDLILVNAASGIESSPFETY